MRVRDVMTETVRTVRPDAPLVEIARVMRDEDIGAVPVADGDRLVGMVTDRDMVIRALADGQSPERATAHSVMSPGMLYCFDDQDIDEVLQNMGDMQIRRLAVLNRHKRLVGMVSIGDLSHAAPPSRAGRSLEEITRSTRH